MFICFAIYAEMRQSACDVGNHMNFYCGFILSMLSPVDAPVSEFKRRGINGENVSQFEARKFAFMFAMNKLGIIAAEVLIHHPEELFHYFRIARTVCI